MNAALVRTVLYPLHEILRGRKTYSFLRDFRRFERLPLEESRRASEQQLVRLIQHAARTVPYWKGVFDQLGLRPDGFQSARQLESLPIMDKALIREQGLELVADSHRSKVFTLATGGSSGEPLIFYTDRNREASQLAAKFRGREWWGIRIGDPQVDLWGSPIEITANDRQREWKDRLLNFSLLSAFDLTDEKMSQYAGFLKSRHAVHLYGYASVLDRYARFLEERGETLHDLQLKGAVSTAEMLFDDQRERISRAFGCPVINEYGCRDGGFIAQECPDGGFHVASDTVHVEIVDDKGRLLPVGEVGEVVLTNLYSFGQPMIRYRLGDRARLLEGVCRCGRTLPLLGSVEGRTGDLLVADDGREVHGLGLMYVLRVIPQIMRYQVIQETLSRVRVRLQHESGCDAEALSRAVEEGTRSVLGQSMKVIVESTTEPLPTLPSGKEQSIVSLLP